jgi:hypothetical protein
MGDQWWFGCLLIPAIFIIVPAVTFPIYTWMMKDVPKDPIGRMKWQAEHGNKWAAQVLLDQKIIVMLYAQLAHAQAHDCTAHSCDHGEDLIWDALTKEQKRYWVDQARKETGYEHL